MQVLKVRNVNGAFRDGTLLLLREGMLEESRAGKVLVCRTPVTTMYHRPNERVLFHPTRDANPVFHLMEALWMLAGRNDATWLDQFVSDFSKRFAEDDGVQHGAYGYRWRQHFSLEGGRVHNQLNTVVQLLLTNPNDRRAVITMWDPTIDLAVDKRDVPCNTHIYPRVRGGYLDITVCCRSNDAVWGAYGANAVHFSVLHEYLAARLALYPGTYYQISNNFHVYEDVLQKLDLSEQSLIRWEADLYATGVAKATPIVTNARFFDQDLARFFGEGTQRPPPVNDRLTGYHNSFFADVAVPLFWWYKAWRAGERRAPTPSGTDWGLAVAGWAARRMSKQNSSEG